MALNTAFSNRITELIGSEYSTIASNSYIDLFNAAISEVADMVRPDLLVKYAVDPQEITDGNGWNDVEGKKILGVHRKDAAGGYYRECKHATIEDFERAKDSTSLYYATKYSPVFTYTTDGGTTVLDIVPDPTSDESVNIYYFAYPTTDKTGATSIEGLPNELEQAVVLKACINILQAYISDFVQDEEDQEMLNMLNGQIQQLQAQFGGEMSRFTDQEAGATGE